MYGDFEALHFYTVLGNHNGSFLTGYGCFMTVFYSKETSLPKMKIVIYSYEQQIKLV